MLAPARHEPSIHWHGWSDEGEVVCIFLVSDGIATVWTNSRLVHGRVHLLVELWAEYAIAHDALCDILFAHELEALRD